MGVREEWHDEQGVHEGVLSKTVEELIVFDWDVVQYVWDGYYVDYELAFELELVVGWLKVSLLMDQTDCCCH